MNFEVLVEIADSDTKDKRPAFKIFGGKMKIWAILI